MLWYSGTVAAVSSNCELIMYKYNVIFFSITHYALCTIQCNTQQDGVPRTSIKWVLFQIEIWMKSSEDWFLHSFVKFQNGYSAGEVCPVLLLSPVNRNNADKDNTKYFEFLVSTCCEIKELQDVSSEKIGWTNVSEAPFFPKWKDIYYGEICTQIEAHSWYSEQNRPLLHNTEGGEAWRDTDRPHSASSDHPPFSFPSLSFCITSFPLSHLCLWPAGTVPVCLS